MDKTIVVAVENNVKHPLYNKIIKRNIQARKLMMRITIVTLVIQLELWKQNHCQRIKDGDLWKSGIEQKQEGGYPHDSTGNKIESS